MNESTLFNRLGGKEGILQLIKPFYADVRQHERLGPVFNREIEDWPSHLNRIAEFWSRQTGGPSHYQGGFAGAHLRLGIPPELVEDWLKLWDFNCDRHLGREEAEDMKRLARQLGGNLQRIIRGRGQ